MCADPGEYVCVFFSGVIKNRQRSGYRIEMVTLTYMLDCKIRVVFIVDFLLFFCFYLSTVSHIHFTAIKSSIE